GAGERANADCQPLFEHLWNTYSDTICPVLGGRGASANADWVANKQIALLDLRGRAPFGLDDMGGAAASRLGGATFTAGNATTQASVGGEASHSLSSAEMPSHTHTATSNVTDPGHFHLMWKGTGQGNFNGEVNNSDRATPNTGGLGGGDGAYTIQGNNQAPD